MDLYKRDRKAIIWLILPTVALFCLGVGVAYNLILPNLLRFLIPLQGSVSFSPLISIEEYFDGVLIVLVGVGLIFDVPILIFLLSRHWRR